jgi:hypothetical protein
MKRIIVSTSMIVFLASTFALGLGSRDGIKGIIPSVQAKDGADDQGRDRFKCTAEELKGNYGLLSDGEFTTPGLLPPQRPGETLLQLPAGPFAAIGRLSIKPNQTFSLTLRQSFAGTIVPAANFPPHQFTGSFILNKDDCTGSLNLNIRNGATFVGVPFDFVVVKEGREIQLMRTTTGAVVTGVAKKQED